jgi:hypothetical protein
MSHTCSRPTRDFDGQAVRRCRPGQVLPAVRGGLAASALGTLAVAMVFLCFPASGGASERPAAAEPAAAGRWTVTCSGIAWGTRGVESKFVLSKCTHPGKTDGRGKYPVPGAGGVVTWASGRTTTLSNINTSEGIGACPPNGQAYHDLYSMTGTFTNSWGGSGTFATGWCLSPKGPYLDPLVTGPFEI